jgi:hypothetical protein
MPFVYIFICFSREFSNLVMISPRVAILIIDTILLRRHGPDFISTHTGKFQFSRPQTLLCLILGCVSNQSEPILSTSSNYLRRAYVLANVDVLLFLPLVFLHWMIHRLPEKASHLYILLGHTCLYVIGQHYPPLLHILLGC